MKRILNLYPLLIAALTLSAGCGKLEYKVYDNPYIFIAEAGDATYMETSRVSARRNDLVKIYNVYFSTKAVDCPVTVNYEIIVGSGLKEGLDFTLDTPGGSLVFAPGTYVMPIQITYLKNSITSGNDNTITIKLTGADRNVTLGIPGEGNHNVSHTITKTKN